MNIDIKEFGEIYSNKYELCPVQRATLKSVTGDVFFTITRLLRLVTFVMHYVLPKMWIIYKNISRANTDAHSFILLTAMTQDPPDFKTGFICSNTKRSVNKLLVPSRPFLYGTSRKKADGMVFR